MPRSWIKSLYCNHGVQDLALLSRRFGVSQAAIRVRLLQLGLTEPAPRCDRYHRRTSERPESSVLSTPPFTPYRRETIAA